MAVIGPGSLSWWRRRRGGISTSRHRLQIRILATLDVYHFTAYGLLRSGDERTLGAVTKRGHAEAIFDGFGPFWGWFSLATFAIVNWLTLITEYIGMTEAMSIFGIPPVLTYLAVTIVLFIIVMTGEYWTFEKLTFFFCAFNFVYIPAAIWGMNTPDGPWLDRSGPWVRQSNLHGRSPRRFALHNIG